VEGQAEGYDKSLREGHGGCSFEHLEFGEEIKNKESRDGRGTIQVGVEIP